MPPRSSPKKQVKNKVRTPEDRRAFYIVLFTAVWLIGIYLIGWSNVFGMRFSREEAEATTTASGFFGKPEAPKKPELDKEAYDAKMIAVANYASTTSSTTERLWPTQAPYPKAGAILPFHRIIAYYGNFYSTKMGVLGEYDEPTMLAKLKSEQDRWDAADPGTPTIPAINYIAITAQGSPGKEGNYELRMPDTEIDKAVAIANKIPNGIVILDIQIGFSSLQKELPLLDKYWAMPNVHLGLDPEFHMIGNDPPGDVIGSYDAADVNYAANYLADFVRKNDLPPKVLVVHRFTQNMVTNTSLIKPLPEVQIVMDMDGWGDPAKKLNTYQRFVATQPVQFTGFKLFYKNDLKPPSTRLLTPQELIKLTPQPLFIQYQ